MNRIVRSACGLLLCALVISCATTQMVGVWTDPTYEKAPVKKVLVIGLGENPTNVRVFETAMASQLKKHHIDTVLGSDVIPAGAPFDTTGGRKFCRDNGIDLVTVTRVLGLSKEAEYVPGTTYYTPAPGYRGFYGFYHTAYSVVSTPGYIREYAVATVETNVYSMKDERLVWSGQSQAVDPTSALDAAGDFAEVFVREMARSGLFGKK